MKYLSKFNESKKHIDQKERIPLKEFLEDVYRFDPDFKDSVENGQDGLEYEVCFDLLYKPRKFEKGFPYELIESINDDEGDGDISRSGIFKRKSDGKCFLLWVGCDSTDEWRICDYLEEVKKKKVKTHKWS
jgi:hypothetical protein